MGTDKVLQSFSYMYIPNKANLLRSECLACQCLDNVIMYKYTKFGQNIGCGARIMSISLKHLDQLK